MSVIPLPSLNIEASCEPTKKYNLYTLVKDTPRSRYYKYQYDDKYQTFLTRDSGYYSAYTSDSNFATKCGINNDLIVTTYSLPRLKTFGNYLWIKDNKLEFVKSPGQITSPQLPAFGGTDENYTFNLYLDVIKNPSVETTTNFLKSVHILRKIEIISDPSLDRRINLISDPNLESTIKEITPENLETFMENNVLKPFQIINHDYSLH
jgi:hypothetical protein